MVAAITEQIMRGWEKLRAVVSAGIGGNGPTNEELLAAVVAEFGGDVSTYGRTHRQYIVDEKGLLRILRKDEMPVVVPR